MQNEANFEEKKLKILILDYFFEFECLNKLDNADCDSINGSTPPDNHQLPVQMVQICKMGPLMHKKVQNFDF